jgi:cytochrome c-type biogenesis protein CcmH/NrfG
MDVRKTIAACVLFASTAAWADDRRPTIALRVENPAAIPAAVPANDTDRGIERFRTRVRQDPRDFISYNVLGSLLVRKGRETGDLERYVEAEAAFRNALERKRDFTPARINLAAV